MLVSGSETDEDFGGGFEEHLRLWFGNLPNVFTTVAHKVPEHPVDFRYVMQGIAFGIVFCVHGSWWPFLGLPRQLASNLPLANGMTRTGRTTSKRAIHSKGLDPGFARRPSGPR